MRRAAALALALATGAPAAQAEGGIVPAPYAELAAELTEIVDFERLPQRPEPGFNLDQPLYSRGAWLGERFAGQDVEAGPEGHDRVEGAPLKGVLRVLPGAPKANLSVAFHRQMQSNALFSLGPAGFPAIEARGEGAVAVLFDHDQAAFGFRIHTEYPDPLGQRPPGGQIEVRFYGRDGAPLGRIVQAATPGIMEFGFRRAGSRRDIAGILILNTDPGGIAVDDIIFARPPLLG